MFCPNCGYDLQKISVTTSQGGLFDVDHCGFCGGTWFDPYEINRIPYHEVVSLANLTVIPKKKVTPLKKRLCPADNTPLEPLKGDAVPRNVTLLWCKKCLGVWASQRDLWEFKKHQDETVSAYDAGEKFFPSLSVAFVSTMTFLFLLATTFTTIISLQSHKEQRIIAESQIIELQTRQIAPDSLIVSFKSGKPLKSSVLYGQSSLEMSRLIISGKKSLEHSVIVTGLKPGSNYLYRIQLTDEAGRSYQTDLKHFSLR